LNHDCGAGKTGKGYPQSASDRHMKKPSDPTIFAPDADTARSCRQLRLMRALIRLDDPEVERALTLIVERLVASDGGRGDLGVLPPQKPPLKPAE
jgi:hypothetical protein